jgi:hypothetical protein
MEPEMTSESTPATPPPQPRPKSFKASPEIENAIQKYREEKKVGESDAICALIARGAGLPQPLPVQSSLASPRDLNQLAAQLQTWRNDFKKLKNRLGSLADMDPKTPQFAELVQKWQELSDKLHPQSEELGNLLAGLAQTLTTITPDELARLKKLKSHLGEWEKTFRSQKNVETADRIASAINLLARLGI